VDGEVALYTEDLGVRYYIQRGVVKALDDVNFRLYKASLTGVVGESGCGKSTLGRAIIRVLPPNGEITSGRIIYNGVNIVELSEEEMRKLRGREIGLVMQDPMTSLDPLMSVKDHLLETILEHIEVSRDEALKMAEEALSSVGLSRELLKSYPHQLSGGQRQRVAIALATVLKPKILIADEPTTALDVIVQKKVLDLIEDLMRELSLTVMLITHDIALAAERADYIGVMYAGHLVEYGRVDQVIEDPQHPYTQLLLKSVPDIENISMVQSIPGLPPDLVNPPPGCRFHPRCPYKMDICIREEPKMIEVGEGHYVACLLRRR